MYLVIDSQHRVLARAIFHEKAQHLAAGHGAAIVNVGTADVATIARIAAADYPRLVEVGTGPLGAGTHPAQPYLDVMLGMVDIGTVYAADDIRLGYDTATETLRRFIDAADRDWTGPVAVQCKARLRRIVEG